MTMLETGSGGFLGANFVLDWLAQVDDAIVNSDKPTYAGNLEPWPTWSTTRATVVWLLAEHRPRAVINFAAESHVGRSIHSPEDFIQTNIVGTFRLLEAVRQRLLGYAPTHRLRDGIEQSVPWYIRQK